MQKNGKVEQMTIKTEVERLLKTKPKNLADDEKKACIKILNAVSKKLPLNGKPRVWAAGIYYTYCKMLLKRKVKRDSISKLFKVSGSAFGKRHSEIRKALKLTIYDKRFTPKMIYKNNLICKIRDAVDKIHESARPLTHEEVSGVVDKISDFTRKNFPGEFKKAVKKFAKDSGERYGFHLKDNTIITESEAALHEFYVHFLIERKISGTSLTPAEHYARSVNWKKKSTSEKKVLHSFRYVRPSIFEVIYRNGNDYKIKDLLHDDELLVKTVDMPPLVKGSLINARALPMCGFWSLYGAVEKISKEEGERAKSIIISRTEELMKAWTDFNKKFVEYFGYYDPEFKNVQELNERLTEFGKWLKDMHGINVNLINSSVLEGLMEVDRIGVISTDRGTNYVPYYGYIKDVFTGNYDKVPDWEYLLVDVVKRSFLIPDYTLKMLMCSNKDAATEAIKKCSH